MAERMDTSPSLARSVHGGQGIMRTPLKFRLQKVKKEEDTRHNLKKKSNLNAWISCQPL